MQRISITECPRDAMQGIRRFIPTEVKAAYIQLLLKVGFDRLDVGSFVSPRAIPQMKDTAEVLKRLDTSANATQLLAIVANVRGAEEAVTYTDVGVIGFPFSVSETFQLRNANSTLAQALDTVREIVAICHVNGKIPLVYLSMGFGNPYGDPWSPTIVVDYMDQLFKMGVRDFALADTVGTSTPEGIARLYRYVAGTFPGVALGLHLHSTPSESRNKLIAALDAGCTRFDTALRGFGGCPMAEDQLTGNIATEALLQLLYERGIDAGLDGDAWAEALRYSNEVF
ncbi:hydroxymethylglutaryl-CoA lyase [Parapedobacter defluvii]|uniref:Hydroxymethylglutaryl-CoA lyase n=1 Tax=Parapedobacter defluvii TaxID=2045106 RepID=A0ABQ1MRD3_9SPHI|nr:hydroxymethylglutaryl-CoA lyase [Parapedobacter defluvii]RQP19127.1 MAG: hydroxymethylglutaryl-CoA lyase [Parapedobacter sp.]GGC45143.1 hydroxymethylglutaryl-CoA lyase [Parapedobacter defluvii]